MGLGSSFNGAAKNAGVLQTLGINVAKSVAGAGVGGMKVNSNMANAASAAASQNKALSSINQKATQGMNDVAQEVRQMQAEIMQAVIETDNLENLGTLFPAGTAPDTVFEFAATAFGPDNLLGRGSLATSAMNAFSAMSPEDFAGGLEGNQTNEEIRATIEDYLRQSNSSAPQVAAVSRMPGEAPTMTSSRNWEAIFDQMGVEDIMAMDPDNLTPDDLHEITELYNVLKSSEKAYDHNAVVQNNIDAGHVKLAGDCVAGFEDGPLSVGGGLCRSVDKPATSEDMEPDRDFVAAASKNEMTGMQAL